MTMPPSRSNAPPPNPAPSRFARPAGLQPLTPAPRSYFRRVLEATRSATKPGSRSRAEAPPTGRPAPRPAGAPVFRRGEPALRLFGAGSALARPWPDNALVAGARVTLSGVVDGASEKLLYDLGLSRIAVEAAPGPRADELTLRFGRRDLAGAYFSALGSLRYINWSARPTAGERRVIVEAIDIDGGIHRIGDLRFAVASAFAMPVRAAPPPERPAEIVSLAAPRPAPSLAAMSAAPAQRPAPPIGPAAVAMPASVAQAASIPAPAALPPKSPVAAPPAASGLGYRIFGPVAERPAAPPTANPVAPSRTPAGVAASPLAMPIEMVWTPETGRLPPRLDEVRPVLSLDDLFGSEHGGDAMLSALARRDRPRPGA
jgi:hypothetical protein